MNLKKQLGIAFFLCLFSFMAFGYVALLVRAEKLLLFDSAIISYIQGLESPGLTVVMEVFTTIGSVPVVLPLSLLVLLILYKLLKHRKELILFAAVMIGSPILNQLLKVFFQRARPDLNRLIEIGGYSFPSGHAMNAFTLYGILTFLLWRHIPVRWGRTILLLFSTVFILAIGTSRIYLGVHYPSDIIGGYLAASFWLAVSILVFQRYKERLFRRRKEAA
ncbi:phosphatase PAP2 family protein [Mesobacillus foraminis]|uniref:phosphatase PAP2 family protein n=1 Tax=Mesobacillus foraminis TaxID=279826 RepID=UPI0039A28541